ncbi:MAG: flagellar biosynthesis anti-sigma factor FlgM [Acidobacteriota bacterium]
MKINGSGSTENLQRLVESLSESESRRTDATRGVTRSGGNTPSDRLDLSSLAREFIKLRASIDAAPQIRQELVDTLRESLQSGRYQVNDEGLAQLLAGEFLGGE